MMEKYKVRNGAKTIWRAASGGVGDDFVGMLFIYLESSSFGSHMCRTSLGFLARSPWAAPGVFLLHAVDCSLLFNLISQHARRVRVLGMKIFSTQTKLTTGEYHEKEGTSSMTGASRHLASATIEELFSKLFGASSTPPFIVRHCQPPRFSFSHLCAVLQGKVGCILRKIYLIVLPRETGWAPPGAKMT